ncbi:hypothetical protein SAMN04515671_2036 [Nakamurella panacisegetis]|uniref:Short C-terminal domain-containing protein n=1 Tax=Nakamurella panacisegetis TaxID=1090615 RepID=A0A1H0MJU2_9ACTN|nr:SHOCT domain-containing protein [Nakamurella panacisegetis]SDO80723.1 hypothetical protein SAMN04515671_2036 [Nakamurella panacisegetis]
MVSFDLKKLFRVPDAQQRLAGLHLRGDLQRAAGHMASDERSDAHLKPVEDLLTETESVIRIVEGTRDRRMGFLVLTTENVIFRLHGAAPGLGEVVPLGGVTDVTDDVKSMTGQVRLETAAGQLVVGKILGTQAAQFALDLREQLRSPGLTPRDPVAELLELRERHAAGLVSDADYRTAKAKLLDQL